MTMTQETAQIPVIDISGGQSEAEVGQALVDAAATYGFVYVKNAGKDIPVAAINRMFELVSHICSFVFENTSLGFG
jgi:isopenicillin N synthase-like dioxygenase